MNHNPQFAMIVSCILVCGLIFGGCSGDIQVISHPTATFFETPSPVIVPSATVVYSATPTINSGASIIALDDLLLLPEPRSTPNSTDSCEHILSPEIIPNANKLSLLSGRFRLCPSISWPLVKTAIDLDKGTLVSVTDKGGDIAMDYARMTIDGQISYYVRGLNNAHIDEIDVQTLSDESCETMLLSLDTDDQGVLNVHEKAIACVMTTENQMALIRVENIYPLDTQSVEFSFAILKKE